MDLAPPNLPPLFRLHRATQSPTVGCNFVAFTLDNRRTGGLLSSPSPSRCTTAPPSPTSPSIAPSSTATSTQINWIST
ncbi:hypothetical protein ACP70R_025661 [Stipagrostis hirtigluma subsp. patula]